MSAQHARDINDRDFLLAVQECRGMHGVPQWATLWEVSRTLDVPDKITLAKFRRVKKRGLVNGCDCGCRGDFELTLAGEAMLVQS